MSVRPAVAMLLAMLVWPTAGRAEPLPEIGQAPPFALASQDGVQVTLSGLRGKVVAVTFLYTACPDICPLLTQKMVEVQDALGPDFGTKIVFVTITLDPERDTPEVLKDYALAFGVNLAGWQFLTGPVAVVGDVVRHYGVFAAKTAEGFVDHNLVTSLIDPRGILRAQYLGMRFDPDEFRRDLLSLVDQR